MVGSDVQNLVGIIVLVLTALGIVWSMRRKPPLIRRLSGVPATDPLTARDGDVIKVVGTIRSNWVTDLAPLSGKRSAWSFTAAYEARGSSRGQSWWWVTHALEVHGIDFLLNLGEGVARVHATNLRVESRPDISGYLGNRHDGFDERAKAFLRRNHVRWTWWRGWGERALLLAETVLEPGDQVAVLGRLRVLSPLPADGIAHEITPLPEGYVVVSDWPETFY